jgi:dTDP-4-amino-4,6-dideoxygalactose transaminase
MKNNDDFIVTFEEKLCEYTGSPFSVVVDRCTNAILLSLEYFKNKKETLFIPKQTYMSVPMTLINYGYNVKLIDYFWFGNYRIGNTNIYDYAVAFEKNMYKSGEIQCLSFQQKKRLSIGKGGAILLDDKNMARTLRRMRHDGRTTHIGTNKDMIENNEQIMIGYHMNMTPDEAAKGILLLNQITENYQVGSYKDYSDLSKLNCFKDYLK